MNDFVFFLSPSALPRSIWISFFWGVRRRCMKYILRNKVKSNVTKPSAIDSFALKIIIFLAFRSSFMLRVFLPFCPLSVAPLLKIQKKIKLNCFFSSSPLFRCFNYIHCLGCCTFSTLFIFLCVCLSIPKAAA